MAPQGFYLTLTLSFFLFDSGWSRKSKKQNLLTTSCWILILTWWARRLALSIRSSSDGEGFLKCSSIKSWNRFVRSGSSHTVTRYHKHVFINLPRPLPRNQTKALKHEVQLQSWMWILFSVVVREKSTRKHFHFLIQVVCVCVRILPEVRLLPAPAFSWVSEWHVFVLLGPGNESRKTLFHSWQCKSPYYRKEKSSHMHE